MSTSQSPPVPPHRFAVRIDDWISLLSGSTATDDDSSPEQTYALLQTEAALAELSSYLQHQLNQLVHGGEAIMNTVTMKQAIECYASQTGRLNELCAAWSGMLAMLTSVAGTLRRPLHASHELALADVYLHFRTDRPTDAKYWLAEHAYRQPHSQERLISMEGSPFALVGQKPDALLVDENGVVVKAIELGGVYNAKRLERFHRWCQRRRLPYEIW